MPFLVLSNVQRADAGSYTVVISNSLGQTSSQAATLTVQAEPFFASTMTVRTVLVGQPTTLSPVLYGEQPMSFQWQFNGTNLVDGLRVTGAASPELTLLQTELSDTGDYSLTVSNALGSTTGLVAHLTVTPVGVWGSGYANVPPSVTNVVAIAAGGYGSMALRADGSVVAWGYYDWTSVPASVTNVVAIAAGNSCDMALRADGSIVAWGSGYSGQINVPSAATNAVGIAAGYSHSMAVRANRTVVAWGNNWYGQTNVPSTATNVVAIAAGDYHSMALRGDGSVVAWGYSSYGLTNVPAEATNVVAIAAGNSHSMALRGDGTVVAWGYPYYGLTNVPSSATNVVAITAGNNHSEALRADGAVVAWGYNGSGQTNVPPWATNAVAVAAGYSHIMALLTDRGQVAAFQPIVRSTVVGSSTLLTAGSLGRGRASFQWQLNGLDIAGATNAALFIAFVNWTNAGIYRVIVSNVFGSVTGPPMVLTVLRTPLRFDTSPEGLQITNS